MKAKTTKKRNPADSTTRNVRAANKRIATLETIVEVLVRSAPAFVEREVCNALIAMDSPKKKARGK